MAGLAQYRALLSGPSGFLQPPRLVTLSYQTEQAMQHFELGS